ncbi:MAG: B12-binding domain-containing radical SAM protein, partial [Clostridia bacterium]|nr:B12-binding domain-containing radical SAM protein [Clostridia bacterium]
MKILFVQPSAGFLMRGTTYPVCRSIMVTASYMQSLGHEVLVFDRCIDFRDADKVVTAFGPDFAMFYIPPTASIKDAIEVSTVAKKCGATVVWGEVVAAAFSHQIVDGGYADFVITGETETKLKRLMEEYCSGRNYSSVNGLTYKENGKVFSTANVNDSELATLPEINWDLIDVRKCFRQFPHCKRMLYMYTSRGCPYKCTYCYNTMFYNSQHRKRPLKYVLNEIKYLEEKYGLDGVNFSDELLLLTDEEIEEIRAFREENNLSFFWGAETRADTYKDIKTLRRMYDSGCRWFMLGLETGSAQTREKICKPMDHTLIRNFVDMCTQVGITTFGSFIIGFHNETPEQLRQTVSLALSLNVDAFLFNYYVVIPKTPMGDDVIRDKGIDLNDALLQSRASSQVQSLSKNYSLIPDKDLLVVKSCFDWMTFTRKKKEASQKNMFINKAVDVLTHFAEGGIKNAVSNVTDAGKTFLTVLFYSHAFPRIKKKYGIINVNKK